MIYRKSKHSLAVNIRQYGICSATCLFTITTWFISAPNINQSTFGIDQIELYGAVVMEDMSFFCLEEIKPFSIFFHVYAAYFRIIFSQTKGFESDTQELKIH